MTPRRATGALAALGLLLGAVGCADDGGSAAGASGLVETSVARAAPADGDVVAGAATVRRVGASLYAPFAAEAGRGNVAFSPVSITLALGMTRAGAEGESASQLDALLGVDDGAAAHRGLNAVESATRDLAIETLTSAGREAEVELSLANSLWGQADATWSGPFLDILKSQYGTGLHTVDYLSDADGARNEVNGWVADQTRDLIPDLIGEGVFTDATRLTLVNALYLAAPWDEELDDQGEQPFTTATGDRVPVPTLGRTGSYPVQRGDGWVAVTLPYAGGDLAMTLLVPDAGRLADVEAGLDADLLDQALAIGDPTVVRLTLPRFDLAAEPALGPALRAVGVTAPFTTGTDFAPMSDDPAVQPLRLADAVHRATVAVDEQGTVASAATATVFERVGAAISDDELIIDRPFLFAIQDVRTATPLFLGRVADPRAG